MSTLENDLRAVLRHLGRARAAMKRFTHTSADWTAQIEIDEEFLALRDQVRRFASLHFGIPILTEPNGRR